ncbi:MAG: hypothetical protein FJX25_04020 [Alphaproteobacteria bacterium]|nr:hypothetical protein [Alphaproteobacteria bacterium]
MKILTTLAVTAAFLGMAAPVRAELSQPCVFYGITAELLVDFQEASVPKQPLLDAFANSDAYNFADKTMLLALVEVIYEDKLQIVHERREDAFYLARDMCQREKL